MYQSAKLIDLTNLLLEVKRLKIANVLEVAKFSHYIERNKFFVIFAM